MAETASGDRLTEAHRVGQIYLATQSAVAARALWSRLDPRDVSGTFEDWLALMVALVAVFDRRSAALAVAYLESFRAAEGFAGGPIVGFETPELVGPTKSLSYMGPGRVSIAIQNGVRPEIAADEAFGNMTRALTRHALAGGRRVLDESALANPRSAGWRRVTDANPCKNFCQELADRVYRTRAKARRGRHWHDGCGCTVEEVFST